MYSFDPQNITYFLLSNLYGLADCQIPREMNPWVSEIIQTSLMHTPAQPVGIGMCRRTTEETPQTAHTLCSSQYPSGHKHGHVGPCSATRSPVLWPPRKKGKHLHFTQPRELNVAQPFRKVLFHYNKWCIFALIFPIPRATYSILMTQTSFSSSASQGDKAILTCQEVKHMQQSSFMYKMVCDK